MRDVISRLREFAKRQEKELLLFETLAAYPKISAEALEEVILRGTYERKKLTSYLASKKIYYEGLEIMEIEEIQDLLQKVILREKEIKLLTSRLHKVLKTRLKNLNQSQKALKAYEKMA